jgi:radical SAM superfamily enzyme YgiQ (UPF0313 family)
LICGDGEDAILELFENNFPSIIDADDPKSSLFLTNSRLNELPWPARHLVDMDSYNYTIDGVRSSSIVGQLGCPYVCQFCSGRNSPFLRRIRTRPAQNILDELEFNYNKYKINGWMFYDDELNVNPKMIELMEGLSKLQKKLGTEFKLRGFIKSELFNEKQAEAIYNAGFRWILTGFESGSD